MGRALALVAATHSVTLESSVQRVPARRGGSKRSKVSGSMTFKKSGQLPASFKSRRSDNQERDAVSKGARPAHLVMLFGAARSVCHSPGYGARALVAVSHLVQYSGFGAARARDRCSAKK